MMEPGQVHADLVVELLQHHPLLTGEAVHGLLDELFRNAELGTGLFHQGPAGIIDVPVVDLLHQRVQRARLNPQKGARFQSQSLAASASAVRKPMPLMSIASR